MKLAYTAGPYRGAGEWEVWQNIQRASEVAHELWAMGYAVICPHRNTMMFGSATIPDDVWLVGDLELLRRSDVVVMLPGWERSEGARGELAEAERCGLAVYYWPEDREALAEMARAEVTNV
mgnify:CR=1 FL=1